jgi:hypothetical protein
MAKKSLIKRIVAKNGEVRYYQNGKRITAKKGARTFIRQNPSAKPLSDREKRSQKALKNYQKGWKFKGQSIQDYYVTILDILKVINKNDIKDNDLFNVFENGKRKFKDFAELKKFIAKKTTPDDKDTPEEREAKKNLFKFCTEKGLPGYRGRDFESFANNRLTNIVDIVDLLNTKTFKYYTFIVIDENGEPKRGRILALLALRDFEIRVASELQRMVPNSAFIRFCYDYKVEPEIKTITINLTDNKPKYEVKEGKDKGKKKVKDLKYYVDNSGGTGEKQSLLILDKFKDVEIEIDFS